MCLSSPHGEGAAHREMRKQMAPHSAPVRLPFGLALVLQTLVGPAAPASAQTAATVTFTCGTSTPGPCSVPTGGAIVVNGNFFPVSQCRNEDTIRISLVPVSGAAGITLGETFFASCVEFGSFRFPADSSAFTLPTSGPGAVPAGTYNVRAFV